MREVCKRGLTERIILSHAIIAKHIDFDLTKNKILFFLS